jgi:NADH dehydrogenase
MRIAVTGAFGYSGRYITERLLGEGHKVITLTNSVHRQNPFGDRVRAFPFNFDSPEKLAESLKGQDALINTYWVRFNHPLFTQEQAVLNTKALFQAAKTAGIQRIVHVSIANPDINSELMYFRKKAELEQALMGLGLSYCILRPTVLFGKEDVLINNIAWSLRHLPAFGVFGDGQYKIQPIYVDDLAEAAAQKAQEKGNEIINATGPETFTYRGLIEAVRDCIGVRRPIVGVPPSFGYLGGKIVGALMRDVVITRDEIKGLMEGRLYVDGPPLGKTKLTEWMARRRDTLGKHYTSEMARRVDRSHAYKSN